MTKADIVKNISDQTGMDKTDVQMIAEKFMDCLLYTSPSPRDQRGAGMASCA